MAEDGKKYHIFRENISFSIVITSQGPHAFLFLYDKTLSFKEESPDREKQMQIFLSILLVALHFFSLGVSSRRRKRHVLLWSDKALLLVLWTCGDVEINPGPANKRLSRSEVLRKFQRCSQTLIVKLIYEISQTEIPKSLYSQGPPGWKEKDEFKNISNLNKGGEEIFDKLILLFKEKMNPLPPEWDVLLKNYQNLKENNNTESKNALERWMLEIDIVPKITLYASIKGEPSKDILEAFKAVSQRGQVIDTLPMITNEANAAVTTDRTNNILCEPSTKERRKSNMHDLPSEETDHQGDTSPDLDTEILQPISEGEDRKTNKRTGGESQLYPILFVAEQNNTFNLEKTVTKRSDQHLFAGTHNLKTTDQFQLKRQFPDEDPILNNPKVPRLSIAERITNDTQRNNTDEQSFTAALDSGKKQSLDEISLSCNYSPVSEVQNDMPPLKEDELDELMKLVKSNEYDESLVPIFLRKYLCQLGNNHPSSEIAELCHNILNKYTSPSCVVDTK